MKVAVNCSTDDTTFSNNHDDDSDPYSPHAKIWIYCESEEDLQEWRELAGGHTSVLSADVYRAEDNEPIVETKLLPHVFRTVHTSF